MSSSSEHGRRRQSSCSSNHRERTQITQIVDAVAEAENAEAIELEPPLAEVIDPDALETLIEI
ncbi:HalOD1 output domain-containing protein [Haloarcula nitratireducens]|uniref:Halobacterial output domain-containing protein n=1 Tax=Haloarcula nitratireducens TaxID=2487749 RepID=A0AAW4PH71_9EURY|nr:hypothetical protein [Halomicroarcula nitratireducens]